MTVLVAFATHTGATRSLADAVAAALLRAGVAAEVRDVLENPDPAGYDAVVLGSGVRMDLVEREARRWAREHRAALAGIPVAFFSCSACVVDPLTGGTQVATARFLEGCGMRCVAVRDFAGRLQLERLTADEKEHVRRAGTPIGDFRDLDAVADWAREIRPLLSA